jgi:hypothetical protein
MRTAIFLIVFGIGSLGILGCSESNSPTASTTTTPAASLAAALIGTWKADTSVTVNVGAISAAISVTASVRFHADSSFGSTLDGDSILTLHAPLQGHLFTDSGTWSARGKDAVVVHPVSCFAPDTATTSIGQGLSFSLPFHPQGTGYVTNSSSATACPDSMVIVTYPAGNKLPLQFPVTIPLQGAAIWHLSFVKQ